MYEFVNYEGAIHSFTSPAADSLGKSLICRWLTMRKQIRILAEMQKVFEKAFGK